MLIQMKTVQGKVDWEYNIYVGGGYGEFGEGTVLVKIVWIGLIEKVTFRRLEGD